ncbi:MAG: hypothetical protein J6U84_03945 [Bacteroidales bacterium]|nr:hypothetical protein [Bacteroidales bacterium]
MKFREIVRGDILLKSWFRRNVWLFLLISVLWILFIANRYNIEGNVRAIKQTIKEIKELEMKRTSIKTQYQKSSMMIELEKNLSSVGVGVSREPIKKVILITENE